MAGDGGGENRIAEGYNELPPRSDRSILTPFAKASFSTRRISASGPGTFWTTEWGPNVYYIDSSDRNGWMVFTQQGNKQPIDILFEGSFASLGIIPGVTNEFWLGALETGPNQYDLDRLPVRLRTVATASLELRLEGSASPFDLDFSAVYGGDNPHTGYSAFTPGTLSLGGSALRENLMGNTYVVTLNRNAPTDDPPSDSAIASVTCTGGSDPGTVTGNDLVVEIGPEENVICTLLMDAQCGARDGATLTTVPTSNLCAVGTPSAVSGTGPWAWDCTAGAFGSPASCAADIQTYPITLSPPVGSGSVSCSPNPVPHGADATCSATPDDGFRLEAFTGDCSGVTCLLPGVTGPVSVGAIFARAAPEEEDEQEEEQVAPTQEQVSPAPGRPLPVPTLPLPALTILTAGLLGWGLRRLLRRS